MGRINRLEKFRGEYEKHLLQTGSQSNWRRAAQSLHAFFSCFPERNNPEAFYTTDCEDFKNHRLEAGKKPRTVKTELGYVRTFFRWLQEEKGLLVLDPTKGIKTSSNAPEEPAELTHSELKAIQTVAPLLFNLVFLYNLTAKELKLIRRTDVFPTCVQTPSRQVSLDSETAQTLLALVDYTPHVVTFPLRGLLAQWASLAAEAGMIPVPSLTSLRRAGVALQLRDLSRLRELASLVHDKALLKKLLAQVLLEPPVKGRLSELVESLPRLLDDHQKTVGSENTPTT